ncbi:MAG: TolC family protein [Phycisphaerales bacterium]|nr:TolC family protein [Phycisphaerales bacterium]
MTGFYSPRLTIAGVAGVVTDMTRPVGTRFAIAGVIPLVTFGCRQLYLDGADREVARLIESRQKAALGITGDARLDRESGDVARSPDMYQFVPTPVDPTVPDAFRQATTERSGVPPAGGEESSNEATPADAPVDSVGETATVDGAAAANEAPAAEPQPFTLSDALLYAMRHARQYQTEKEMLYLAALDLTLERFLWTPRFVESALTLGYDNAGQLADWDQTMDAVAAFAVEQRLPYGGEVTARVVHSLVRHLSDNVSTSETGQVDLDVSFPLLRGAGPAAYEDRYQRERELVYAVRDFERFRRVFLVDIAGDYFDLLSAKTQIASAESQATNLNKDYDRDKARADAGFILPIDADRARVAMLNAQNNVVNTRERYETTLDVFKIRIGMTTETRIDVVEEPLALYDPRVSESVAIETALKTRLDLVTRRNIIDDARRHVLVARNDLLPGLDVSGGGTLNTDPEHLSSRDFNTDRTSWRAGVTLELPLNRQAERNTLRRRIIDLRRAERAYDEEADNVRAQVRRALRRIDQARSTLDIQEENIKINELRADMARFKFELGEIPSNRDVVEAESDLRNARDDYAVALSDYRRAILEFLRDTETLRISDDGKWIRYDAVTGEPVNAGAVGDTDSSIENAPEAAPAGG